MQSNAGLAKAVIVEILRCQSRNRMKNPMACITKQREFHVARHAIAANKMFGDQEAHRIVPDYGGSWM